MTANPSRTDLVGEATWQVCENDEYSVAYPPDWFVHPPDATIGVAECALFAAAEFEGEAEPDWGWTGAQVVLGMGAGCRGTFEAVVATEEVW